MKFRRRPEVIEARQWQGPRDRDAFYRWAYRHGAAPHSAWTVEAEACVLDAHGVRRNAKPGDWVVCDVFRGRFRVIRSAEFAEHYEPVADDEVQQ